MNAASPTPTTARAMSSVAKLGAAPVLSTDATHIAMPSVMITQGLRYLACCPITGHPATRPTCGVKGVMGVVGVVGRVGVGGGGVGGVVVMVGMYRGGGRTMLLVVE